MCEAVDGSGRRARWSRSCCNEGIVRRRNIVFFVRDENELINEILILLTLMFKIIEIVKIA